MNKWQQMSVKYKVLSVCSVLLVLLIVLYWQVGAERGWFNTILLSSPSDIYKSFQTLWGSGSLQKHILVSFKRVMIGYLSGAGLGILVGFILSTMHSLDRLLSFLMGIIRPIPALALFPLFILWFGIGEASKIVVIAFMSFWPTFLNTEEGVRQADKNLLELADALQKSRINKMFTVLLPSTLPYIFAGLRLAISRAWGGVVVAEMLAASSGIGFLIEYSRDMSQTASMFVGVITIAIIGCAVDMLLRFIQSRVCYWHTEV